MSSGVFPKYAVQSCSDKDSDVIFYVADRPWPDPARAHLRVSFHGDVMQVTFDSSGKPCDVQHTLTPHERQKIRARRKTPRGTPELADDFDLGPDPALVRQ